MLDKYVDKILKLSDGSLTKESILSDEFMLEEKNDIKIYYAPHNEYLNEKARVLIVGICPGWTQTKIAYERAVADLKNSLELSLIKKRCKMAARFAGSMRKNLILMLDDLELNKKLNIDSTFKLFLDNELLHTTSLIPYPVFVKGKNYTGYTPDLVNSSMLMKYVRNHFYEEIKCFDDKVFIIPLGKAVEDVLKLMVYEKVITNEQCLFGFPHPSGANGHRKSQFEKNKVELMNRINFYF